MPAPFSDQVDAYSATRTGPHRRRSVVTEIFRRIACAGTICGAVVLLGACSALGTGARDQAYKNFLTAVAKAPQDGYTPYWLGRECEAGGLTFTGPSVPDFCAYVEGDGVSMD